jgi:hypothetical protein
MIHEEMIASGRQRKRGWCALSISMVEIDTGKIDAYTLPRRADFRYVARSTGQQ